MNIKRFLINAFTLAVLVACVVPAAGAEIQLKSLATVQANIVRLGDVAQIFASSNDEKKRLAKVELCLAPSSSSLKVLHVRELKQTLQLRGVRIGNHRFDGSAQVKILRQAINVRRVQYQQVSDAKLKTANKKVAHAIKTYLKTRSADRGPWKVSAELSSQDAVAVLALGRRFELTGGKSPYTGLQQFEIVGMTNRGQIRIPVKADIAEEEGIVMTTRSLQRGTTLRASDLKLVQPQENTRTSKVFHSIQDVVGKELTRSVSNNQTLSSNYVRAKILVKRGEGVTVYSFASGIMVKTIGRARESGSKGQMIEIESTLNRKRFFAKVHAPQTVTVNASSQTVTVKN